MGWSYGWKSKQELVAKLRILAPGYTMLADRVVGNHLWYVVQTPEGRKTTGLCLLARDGGEWGYKGMGEDAGPTVCDCPLSLLAMCDAPQGYAVEWRERVKAYHAARAAKAKLTYGCKVSYGGHVYVLTQNLGRLGWRVTRTDGVSFRMRAHQLRDAVPA